MTAVPTNIPPPGGWSVDDLDGMPEDGRKRELIDGALLMSPSPTDFHQSLAWRLAAALDESCPLEYSVTQAVEVRLNSRRCLVPDVQIVANQANGKPRGWFGPHEVVLVVEIVSKNSKAMDRITKPALYAQAGIPHFWRVETEGEVVVETFDLDRDIYRASGRWTDVVRLSRPWPLEVAVKRLLPREFR